MHSNGYRGQLHLGQNELDKGLINAFLEKIVGRSKTVKSILKTCGFFRESKKV